MSRRWLLAYWAAAVVCLCWATAAAGDVEPARQAALPTHKKQECSLLNVCNNPEACPIMRETPPAQFTVRFKTNVGSFRVRAVQVPCQQLHSCQGGHGHGLVVVARTHVQPFLNFIAS
jgi:hypothetical protein